MVRRRSQNEMANHPMEKMSAMKKLFNL